MTKDPDQRITITKPDDYDPARYEVQRRYLLAGGSITPPSATLPGGKSGVATWHKLGGNLPWLNAGYAVASHAERQRLLSESRSYTQGLLWFLGHDQAVPNALRQAWAAWGLPEDEFVDNSGWPRMFYVRNGRRMLSDFVLTEAHGRKVDPLKVDDSVGLVWWPHDLHEARRIVKDGAVWHEGIVFDDSPAPDWIPFGIAFRALVPRRAEAVNLLTPTCPSSSYVAYGAYRLEGQFMIAAQSAATAAVLAIESNLDIQDVPYEPLRQRLLADGQVLTTPTQP